MNKAQWKAIREFCREYGFENSQELLQDLKGCGIINSHDTVDDLGYYPNGKTYDDMYQWLQEGLL